MQIGGLFFVPRLITRLIKVHENLFVRQIGFEHPRTRECHLYRQRVLVQLEHSDVLQLVAFLFPDVNFSPVRRGSLVKEGDIIAVLSDEAREARVLQARAMLLQRKTELAAKMKLVEQGTMPKLEAVNLETQFKAAEAGLAAAEAEKDRSIVRAPWSGIVNDVPVEVGQAVLQMMGKEIAQIVSIDPILAVVEVAERNLAGVHVGEGGFAGSLVYWSVV